MAVLNRFKAFDDSLFERHPELKDCLKPNDHYPELSYVLMNRPENLPAGSVNSKVIINNGKIVERVYRTPKGNVVSLVPKSSNAFFYQAA